MTTVNFTVTDDMVSAFAALSGDYSAVHMDEAFARRTRFRRRIAHGMLSFVHLLKVGRLFPGRRIELERCEAKFLKPAFIGDELQLQVSLDPLGNDRHGYLATWTNAATGAVLIRSEGVIVAGPASMPAAPEIAVSTAPLTSVEQSSRAISDLDGSSETLPFVLSRAHAHRLEQFVAAPEGSAGATFLAALLLSPLVGMRMPGRHATFLSFSLAFSDAPAFDEPCTLVGTVDKILPGADSVGVSVMIRQGNTVLAVGDLASLVNPPPGTSLSAAAIRDRHLDPGLRDKVVLITGASRGIGATTAKLLAMHGSRIVINYHRGKDDAEQVVADIRSAGGHAEAIGCDITDEQQVNAMFRQIDDLFSGVDLVINNAVGGAQPTNAAHLAWPDLLSELDVSLKGMIACCQAALPRFRMRGAGKIVNLSTIYVDNPVKGQSAYITAKSAVVGYSRALAREVAGDNIQVNVVAPNMTQTDLLASLPTAMVRKLGQARPARRNLEAIEVAQAIMFLASRWSDGMTGQKLVINLGDPPFQ